MAALWQFAVRLIHCAQNQNGLFFVSNSNESHPFGLLIAFQGIQPFHIRFS